MADHANNLASKIRNNLTNSMKALGVDILTGFGTVLVSHTCCHAGFSGNATKRCFGHCRAKTSVVTDLSYSEHASQLFLSFN